MGRFVWLMLIAIGIQGNLQGQADPLKAFYQKYQSEGSQAVNLGGLMIRVGAWFADTPEERKLIRKIKHLRLIQFEDVDAVDAKDIISLKTAALDRGFETLLESREDGEQIQVFALEKREQLHRMLVLTQDGYQFTAVSLKGTITYEEFAQTVLEEF